MKGDLLPPERRRREYFPTWLVWLVVAGAALLWAAQALAAPTGKAAAWGKPGTLPVAVIRYDWKDEKRRRAVPVKLYYPAPGAGPFPVVIVSHGLGGSRENYEYLGRHLASHGYVSVHLQHKGSDRAIWEEDGKSPQARIRAGISLANSLNRPLDLRFVLNRLEKLNRDEPPLKGRLDLSRVGAVGHSYGAYTVLAAGGLAFPGVLGRTLTLADPRVKALIPMSTPVPPNKSRLAQSFGNIRVPCLHLTGTRDDSLVTGAKAEERRLPYENMHKSDQYLITFKGGDHLIFSGRPPRIPGGERDAHFQALIRLAATAFLETYLKGNAAARQWLTGGGLAAALGDDGILEMKPAPPMSPSPQPGEKTR